MIADVLAFLYVNNGATTSTVSTWKELQSKLLGVSLGAGPFFFLAQLKLI